MTLVYLERVTRGDAADRANQDYHLPWVASFIDQAGFDAWFGRLLTGPNIGFVARHADSMRIVGVVNINEIVAGVFQSAYLGYDGMHEFCRKGLMMEALRQATEYAFNEPGLHRLEANIQPENLASIGLVRRLGFRREGISPRYLRINGEWRDHERWALLADYKMA
jgi:ribosomal-protein-alanine N-acetyltransferase